MAQSVAVAVACASLAWGCSSKAETETKSESESEMGAPANTTINAFFGGDGPTFVAGTVGDEEADEGIAAQIELIRGSLFPDAPVVADTAVDRGAWPERPVIYGGAHVNALVAELDLPFELDAGRLVIGGETFTGDGYALVAIVPASGDRPELAILGGTGTPGVAGINAGLPGGDPILIKDVFGPLAIGRWVRDDDGALRAELTSRARRLPWRDDRRALAGSGGGSGATATIHFLKDFRKDDEAARADACMRGLATVVRRLAIAAPASVDVYVYPDAGSKKSLTGNGGAGHAVVAMRALHMVPADPAPGGDLEGLMAHEGTHVLAYEHVGPERTAFLAEGLAVWVSGRYGGKSLDAWREDLRGRVNATPRVLLGPMFRELRESASYPVAGLFVGAVIDEVGLEAFGEHLYGATAATWDAACERAGTTAGALDAVFARLFAR